MALQDNRILHLKQMIVEKTCQRLTHSLKMRDLWLQKPKKAIKIKILKKKKNKCKWKNNKMNNYKINKIVIRKLR